MSTPRAFDPDHCTACGDFLPCGQSWLHEAEREVAETCWRSECRTGCYYIETCTEGENYA